ncbi:serum opacification factor [Streptococcus merionis]|uniref:serum opacification factor n=1 Tax=Streptococcus merionis TaxID=400065 RepID=UPI00351784F8
MTPQQEISEQSDTAGVTPETITVERAEESQSLTTTQPESVNTTSEDSQLSSEKLSKTVTSSQGEDPSHSPRSERSAQEETATQMIEVEHYSVDKPAESKVVKDEKNLIVTRDKSEKRELFKVERDVKVDVAKGEIDVTLTVTPREIDKGAEVIVLLDTSNKMSDDDFNTAKEHIKKLVTTLTSQSTDNTPNYNNRNAVRLIDFYRHVGDPIELTTANVDDKLAAVRKKAIEDYNGWGVDLQGAIHRAREIFNKEKASGKRQHIVLFSQGEATFSYDTKDKNKLSKTILKEPVTSSNPLLPWPFYVDSTTSSANLVKDAKRIQEFLKKLGISRYGDLLDQVVSQGGSILNLGSSLLGTNSPLDYITLSELNTKDLQEKAFDYSKKLGEGYHFRSYYTRESSEVPLKNIVKSVVKSKIEKLKKKIETEDRWFDVLGIADWSDSISKALGADQLEEQMINKVIDYLFYKRDYIYYNHNLSAQAEAKMARDEGITFYAFDVTDPNRVTKESKSNSRSEAYTKYLEKKAEEAKKTAKERNDRFDKYLKEMSDGRDFFKDVDDKDKFKDALSELKMVEKFSDKVTVKENSWKAAEESSSTKVNHTRASSGWFSTASESLTWTISKEQLQKAFETETPLTLTYKLNIDNAKFRAALNKRRQRRSTSAENNNLLVEKIVANTISYKINDKSANAQNLEDVRLTYSRLMVPVPELDGEVIEPQAPQLAELPPIIAHGPNLDFEEETGYQLPLEHGRYAPNTQITFTEDTKSDIVIGGHVIDFTEETITTETGHNSTDSTQEIIEDTRPATKTIIIGGQNSPIEITEDTMTSLAGHSGNTTLTEDTKSDTVIGGHVIDFTEETITTETGHNSTDSTQEIIEDTRPATKTIIIGGQNAPIEITEDTMPSLTGHSGNTTITEDTQTGISGLNKATVIEEEKRSKPQCHFDNEEPSSAVNQTISQPSVSKVENRLPQTGDKDKPEAFFTAAALTVIGAVGLLSKKSREDQSD